MATRFTSFVILAEMRTGSNLLESSLNSVPGITCHGEAFNTRFIGHPKQPDLLGITQAARDADPGILWDRIRNAGGLNGFRFFHDHDPRVPAMVLPDPTCAKIILTRNPLDSYVSLKIARETGQWKLGDARHRKEAKVRFDGVEFEAHVIALQGFQMRVQHMLQTSGQTAFYLGYEDVQDEAVLRGLLSFLGQGADSTLTAASMVRQNPGDLDNKLVNPADVAPALARLDRFNLTRTPLFEPRRGPAVPSFVAARGAPLLFMPVRSGPEARVRHWLASLGADQAGLIEGFTQKSLRAWWRANPGHRSFTVVRHPVARAHAAFCDTILTGRYADLREVLRKTYKLPLPPVAEVAKMDLATHRAAFAAFLGFLRGNLAGQTNLRVDPAWASQSAVIAGFSSFATPDLIAREDRLAEDLAFLADSCGMAARPLPEADPDLAPFALAEVHDANMEAAARAAYARDYDAFGFGDWSTAT